MAKVNQTPRISVNKLGEYLVSKAGRQARILYDAKFPSDAIVPYYKDAEEVISQFIAGGAQDIGLIEKKIQLLDQTAAGNVYQTRRIAGNIEAIESFMNLLDDLKLNGATPLLGARQGQSVTLGGVEISVRPEIVLKGKNAKGATIGGLKLHFPKSSNLSDDAAAYVSAILQHFFKEQMPDEGTPDHKLSFLIDVPAGRVHSGTNATRQRMKDVAAGCAQIANLWPTIKP